MMVIVYSTLVLKNKNMSSQDSRIIFLLEEGAVRLFLIVY
jgi:hypothetical protein